MAARAVEVERVQERLEALNVVTDERHEMCSVDLRALHRRLDAAEQELVRVAPDLRRAQGRRLHEHRRRRQCTGRILGVPWPRGSRRCVVVADALSSD